MHAMLNTEKKEATATYGYCEQSSIRFNSVVMQTVSKEKQNIKKNCFPIF